MQYRPGAHTQKRTNVPYRKFEEELREALNAWKNSAMKSDYLTLDSLT